MLYLSGLVQKLGEAWLHFGMVLGKMEIRSSIILHFLICKVEMLMLSIKD